MQLNIDPAKLRQMTNQAIADAEQRRQQKLAEKKAQQEREHRENLLKAESIIHSIPEQCAKAAENGEFGAIVMKLKHMEDYVIDSQNWGKLNPSQLKGVGALVYKACQDAKLNTSLTYWHDGEGMHSGFDLIIHW